MRSHSHWLLKRWNWRRRAPESFVYECSRRVCATPICRSLMDLVPGLCPLCWATKATGEIVEAGAEVKGFAVGDRVVFSFVPNCGRCSPCASGRASLCEPGAAANAAGTLLGGGRRWLDAQGVTLQHHLGVSGFAEYTVVSAHSAVRIDRDLAPEAAALFGCAVMTGVGAVVNTAKVAPGESVAIFGLGGVGLAAVLGARAAGAHPLIAVDVATHKFELARELERHSLRRRPRRQCHRLCARTLSRRGAIRDRIRWQ